MCVCVRLHIRDKCAGFIGDINRIYDRRFNAPFFYNNVRSVIRVHSINKVPPTEEKLGDLTQW